MGRHSQTSSWSTTLVELGALASKSLPGSNSTGTRGRRRAQGAAKTSVAPMMYRAGGVAAALSIAVSGGAYAATQVNDGGGKSLNETEVRLAAIGSPNGSVNSQTSGLTIEGQSDSVYTVTEESTEEHGRVEKETDSLPEGETKVETEGVDGLVRTTYEVTSKDAPRSRGPLCPALWSPRRLTRSFSSAPARARRSPPGRPEAEAAVAAARLLRPRLPAPQAMAPRPMALRPLPAR